VGVDASPVSNGNVIVALEDNVGIAFPRIIVLGGIEVTCAVDAEGVATLTVVAGVSVRVIGAPGWLTPQPPASMMTNKRVRHLCFMYIGHL
jgi:hypothetical protein